MDITEENNRDIGNKPKYTIIIQSRPITIEKPQKKKDGGKKYLVAHELLQKSIEKAREMIKKDLGSPNFA
jgi:hypothetical protein